MIQTFFAPMLRNMLSVQSVQHALAMIVFRSIIRLYLNSHILTHYASFTDLHFFLSLLDPIPL